MSVPVKHGVSWVSGLAVGALIAGTVGVLAQQSGVEQTPTGPDLYRSEAARAAVADARGLSAAFRDVADAVLPAIVSIEAEGAARRVSIGDGEIPEEFFRNSPFGDDPRLRELFRRRQRGGTRMIPPRRSKGSGFVIDAREGIVLTNSHVVADADEVTVRLHDGRELVAEEVLTDPRTDVAVVRIEPDGLTEVPLGDSDSARIGDWVLAFGSPFGLDMSVTAGIVSAKGRGPGINDREDYIQTDAAVNPGNSGGPLVDLSGRVVGINTAISSRSGGYDGIAFAIPVRMAKWVADQLVDSGEVKRAYLGVAIQDIDGDLADEFGIEVPRGAIVTKIFDGSPAANAGLKVGDVIVRLNGREVTGPKKLQVVVEELRIGSTYEIEVVRDGRLTVIPISFREMPTDFGLAEADSPDGPSDERGEEPESTMVDELGLELGTLDDATAEGLGYPEGTTGLLVTAVVNGGPADRAGLRAGMVLTRVGLTEVVTPDDFVAAVDASPDGDSVLLLVATPRGTRFVKVERD